MQIYGNIFPEFASERGCVRRFVCGRHAEAKILPLILQEIDRTDIWKYGISELTLQK